MPQGVLHRLTRMSDECRTGFAFGRESTKVRGTHAPVPPQLRWCCLQRIRLLNVSWGGRAGGVIALRSGVFMIDDRVLPMQLGAVAAAVWCRERVSRTGRRSASTTHPVSGRPPLGRGVPRPTCPASGGRRGRCRGAAGAAGPVGGGDWLIPQVTVANRRPGRKVYRLPYEQPGCGAQPRKWCGLWDMVRRSGGSARSAGTRGGYVLVSRHPDRSRARRSGT